MRLVPLLLALVTVVAQADRPVRVYVDLSREYSDEWASLAEVDGIEATVGFATPSTEVLSGYDVVVVYYNRSDAPWTAIMGEAAVTHVRRGGGLLAIGHGGHWREARPDAGRFDVYQANRLAKPLGFQFATGEGGTSVAGLLRVIPDARTEGVDRYQTAEPAGVVTDLSSTGTSLVESASGYSVLSAKTYGRGRVACCADPTGFVPGGANGSLVTAMLRWLGAAGAGSTEAVPSPVVAPEVRVRTASVSVAVSQAFCSVEGAEGLGVAVGNIASAVASRIGNPSGEAARVVVLPRGAPALDGATCVAPCSESDPWELIAACARSATDATLGLPGLPEGLDRGLVEWIALESLADLGYVRAPALLEGYRRTWREASPEEIEALDERPATMADLGIARSVARVDRVARRLGPDAWRGFLDLIRGREGVLSDGELVETLRLAFGRATAAVIDDLGSASGAADPPAPEAPGAHTTRADAR